MAERGSKILYNVTSSTRDHITASYTVSASGMMVPPRCVFKGVRNMAAKHLKDLPKSGASGEWGLSVTPKVFEYWPPSPSFTTVQQSEGSLYSFSLSVSRLFFFSVTFFSPPKVGL